MFVSICVITYKRPDGLERLLTGLNQLGFNRILSPEIEVIVVDNDVNCSAFRVYEALKPTFKYGLSYHVESRRGISYARNHSIGCVHPDSNFIAFIDDDEVPTPPWLEELLIVQSAYDADVVHGPVLPHFQSDVPIWVVEGHFFDPKRYSTGQNLEAAYTNNLLVKASLIKTNNPVFDARFALTGGEDSYLFRTLHHQGKSLVWADEALVYEWIPSSRTTMKWLLMRAYRGCLSYTTWEREVKFSNRIEILPLLKGMFQIMVGLSLLIPSFFAAKHTRIKVLLYLYQGLGRLSALLGVKYEEYRQVHGT